MKEVVIASAVRTAVGKFGGTLKDVPAVELGATVIREAIKRAGIKPEMIDETIMGNVIQAGLGQSPARQAAVKAGIPVEIPAFTLNKVCGSGLRAVSRSEEHTSELQSRQYLVCRLLLEKKKKHTNIL